MTYKEHFKRNWILAWPVMLTQAGQIMVNVVDNIMVGALGSSRDIVLNPELGKISLGAVSLGNAVFFTILVTAFGFSFAMSPLIAQADARKNRAQVNAYLSHGLVLNLSLAVLLMIVVFLAAPFMYYLKQPIEVVDQAIPYLKIMAYSMIPMMIFQSFRQFSEGISLTIIVTIATLVANLFNIAANYALIYGNWGFPRMEVEGAAWGTMISRILMMIFIIIAMFQYRKSRFYLRKTGKIIWQKSIFNKLTKLGTPTALQMFFEVSTFSVAAFICGMAGVTDLAAHQIALNLASTTFMLCVGISVAATVRVGNQLGLHQYNVMRQAGISSIFMVAIFMIFCGILFVVFRYQLPQIYIENTAVITLTAQLLIIAAFFQLSDGVQVVTLGALRGMQDVNIPTIITLVAYFVLTIPLGYFLTITMKMGAMGMWIALGIGLTFSAVLLIMRFQKISLQRMRDKPNISDLKA
ncbi:MAG: MATE family efflux transporter [Weeksellaceae bacterium]|nr:MATE family efflux transporter [Weeksellaceae bacterium]